MPELQWQLHQSFLQGPMHHRAYHQYHGGLVTVVQFLFLIIGIGFFAWAHPELATVLLLIAISRLLWKWSS